MSRGSRRGRVLQTRKIPLGERLAAIQPKPRGDRNDICVCGKSRGEHHDRRGQRRKDIEHEFSRESDMHRAARLARECEIVGLIQRTFG